MEYQKILNLLDNTPNDPTRIRTKSSVDINDEPRRTYNTNNQIRFKTSLLRSSLCVHSDAYILVQGTITVANTGTAAAPNNADKKVIFKNFVPFTSCISRINNTQIDGAQYIDVVMPIYNLIEYSDNYSKTSGILFHFCRDVPAVDDKDDETIVFTEANATIDSFNPKLKLTGQTGRNGTKNVEIMIPLKCLYKFWRSLEMPLINCEITLNLIWSENGAIVATNAAAQSITDTKLYVPVVTLSTQDNAKLLEQLRSGFKRAIN